MLWLPWRTSFLPIMTNRMPSSIQHTPWVGGASKNYGLWREWISSSLIAMQSLWASLAASPILISTSSKRNSFSQASKNTKIGSNLCSKTIKLFSNSSSNTLRIGYPNKKISLGSKKSRLNCLRWKENSFIRKSNILNPLKIS